MRSVVQLLVFTWILFPISHVEAQWDTLGKKEQSLKILSQLPQADQIEVDSEGNIFLLSREEGLLHKYLSRYDYDSSFAVGGISTREDGFLRPRKLALKNRQDFYLLDDLGRKIVLLDKELKRVASSDFYAISSNSAGFADEFEPISFDINNAGETYVVNKNNNKIYKINAFGDIEIVFGGLDYGEGSLYDPIDIQISPGNKVYVSDIENQELKVFDIFGVFLERISAEDRIVWESFHIEESYLFLWNSQELYILNLLSQEWQLQSIPGYLQLIDLYISREIIYLLLENEVHLYSIKE